MEEFQGTDAFIAALNDYGVETVFFNPGIDNVPVLEALSKYESAGKPVPKKILCLDEFVAMTAAHGNYMASDKPQCVLVHSELGTLQIGGALHNAQWGRVPVVFCAEPLGPDGRTSWKQEPFDQGMIVRNCVKWDHRLDDDEELYSILSKAFKIATKPPCGPVYLTIPRDRYQLPAARPEKNQKADSTVTQQLNGLDTDLGNEITTLLIQAQNPLIVTGYSGRQPGTVSELIRLAETIGAPIVQADIRMNAPNNHPLVSCLDPDNPNRMDTPYLAQSDLILAIDYDMHYAAPPTVPKPEAKIIHLDMDLNKRGEPLWKRKPDISAIIDSARAIPELSRTVRDKITPERRHRIDDRIKKITETHLTYRSKWQSAARRNAHKVPITADWLCHCINEAITSDTIIVNQVITPANSVYNLIERTNPGSLLSCAGGSIGWPLAASIGVKLANPDKTVIGLMGDGAFVYGCPVASLWTAATYQLPFLAIVFNNLAYNAIKGLFRQSYQGVNMGADIQTPPNFAEVASACHAFGITVDSPENLPTVLEQALKTVEKGTTAVVDVRLN